MWAQNLFSGVSVFSKTILFRWYKWVHNWCDQGRTQKFLKGWGFNFLKSNQIQFQLIYCNHYSNQNVQYSQTGFSGNSWILLQHLFIQKPCNLGSILECTFYKNPFIIMFFLTLINISLLSPSMFCCGGGIEISCCIGAKPPAIGGTGVWELNSQRWKVMYFFAKIT